MFLSGAGPRLILLVSAAVSVVLGASAPPHLKHIAGSSRKIRMYMVNAYLQLNLNGSVSGSSDDTSPSTEITFLQINFLERFGNGFAVRNRTE
ncbi:hypothetical protein GE061_013163 [Apolygus lucorum]|uniref:Uncharacterized protein n=1 Tax=Apolygus lucorum TaxID=248454 RepID=A0A8S9XUN1_APOLU|nr:hypothetical protein GE061_013163 [Apolygus lucorum]